MAPARRSGLTGSNCTLGGQTILSLSVTEDFSADYATAAAVCIAEGGAHAKGSTVETVEGGVSTGLWVVDRWSARQSGEETWRRKEGGAGGHIPIASYSLRRQGYLQARGTLSKSVLGADRYPPKFATTKRMLEIIAEAQERLKNKEISTSQYLKEIGSWIQVSDATAIINYICGWVGLGVAFKTSLSVCAPEYLPVSKSAMTACREVASWSGADCYLRRDGSLLIYNFNEQFNRGGTVPSPGLVTAIENKDGMYSINQVTVIGSGYGRYWHPPQAGHFRPPGGNPNIPAYDPPRPGYWTTEANLRAVEVTESVGERGQVVEQRIEISEYPITPTLAQLLARTVLAKEVLSACTAVIEGQAQGAQGYEPVVDCLFTVSRTLNWTGSQYRYLCTIEGPRAGVGFGGGTSTTGWWG